MLTDHMDVVRAISQSPRRKEGADFLRMMKNLLTAGTKLKEWYDIVCHRGRILPEHECEKLVKLCKTHCVLIRAAGMLLAPKHHAFYDLSNDDN